jgi:protein tyrosine/serine phosphatase
MSRRRAILLATACLAASGLVVAGPLRSYVFESNLHAVVPGAIYRSAQPSDADIERWTQELSLRSIVNLRGAKSKDDRRWLAEERAAAERNGLEHVSLRLSADDMPPAPRLRELVAIIDRAPRPMLMHCRAGAERSGLASAVAILLEGGDVATARTEFALDKGFLHVVNPRLPRVLDEYETWLAGAPSTADRFRSWVATEYAPYFYRARIEAIDVPARVALATPAELRVRVTNTSRQTIRFQSDRHRGVHLGAHLLAPGDEKPRELRGGFVDLELAPGAATEMTLPLPALDRPGRWELELDLVDEGVKWFEAQGSQSLQLPIEVAEAEVAKAP